ncbi:MAG: response regulator [SAR202 cluster bacterium]|nr:response regulator [SAR202 cluster bacterium]
MTPRILIVEDERITALDIRSKLHRFGFRDTTIVASGEEAIKKAEQTKPSLVLMDIVLQGEMDGIDAAAHIQSHLGIPVIFLTAYGDAATASRAMRVLRYKSVRFITKPFDEESLRITIQNTLDDPDLHIGLN